MNLPSYLSPKEVAEKLEDARCTSCEGSFTEEDFEQDKVLVINKIEDEKVVSRRLAHWDCWFNQTDLQVQTVNLSDILEHPLMSLAASDYIDQDEEE